MGDKFPLGTIVLTPQAAEVLKGDNPLLYIGRHRKGDWGEVSREVNEYSLEHNLSLVSMYTTCSGKKILVVTSADRLTTTIMSVSN